MTVKGAALRGHADVPPTMRTSLSVTSSGPTVWMPQERVGRRGNMLGSTLELQWSEGSGGHWNWKPRRVTQPLQSSPFTSSLKCVSLIRAREGGAGGMKQRETAEEGVTQRLRERDGGGGEIGSRVRGWWGEGGGEKEGKRERKKWDGGGGHRERERKQLYYSIKI